MNKRLTLILLLLAAVVAIYLLLRRGPGRFDPGLPADEDEAARERTAFLAAAEAHRRGRRGS